MLRIVLIRPGATDYDCEERIQGALDIPLSRDGLMEVSRAIDQLRELRIETVYSSPCAVGRADRRGPRHGFARQVQEAR